MVADNRLEAHPVRIAPVGKASMLEVAEHRMVPVVEHMESLQMVGSVQLLG